MRLIDADEFFKDFTELEPYEHISHEYNIDAVEVVRCENCVHWKDEGFDSAGKCELWNIVFEYDWFCADGEKAVK